MWKCFDCGAGTPDDCTCYKNKHLKPAIYFYDDCYEEDVCDILGRIPKGRYYHDQVEIDGVTWYFVSIEELSKEDMINEVNDGS